MSVRNLVEEFSALEDPRCGGKVEHRLVDILIIAVCAVIAGAESWEDIALYGRSKGRAAARLAGSLPVRGPPGPPANGPRQASSRSAFSVTSTVAPVSASMAGHSPVTPASVAPGTPASSPRLHVAARNHNRSDAQSRAVSGAH